MQASYLKFNFLTNDDHKTLMFSLKTNKIFTIFARITSITINDIYEHKKNVFNLVNGNPLNLLLQKQQPN